jgi:hypothetical protein
MSDIGWLILAAVTNHGGRGLLWMKRELGDAARPRAPTRGALDAASGGANRRAQGRHLCPRSRRAGSPANEHGRGEAYTHQKREGGGGAADYLPGMGNAGQAGGNGSAGDAEPDQADCDSHR